MSEANQDDGRQAAFGQRDAQYAVLDRMMQGRDGMLIDRRAWRNRSHWYRS